MPISVRDLLELPGLGLTVVAGRAGLDHPIRWVHTSEIVDPTPWLRGGELLLTTGMGLEDQAERRRAYVGRLVEAGLAGLGWGLGFGFERVPDAVRDEADARGFPLLEVPYPVPFIAIAEAVSSRLTQDRLRDVQASLDAHERLAALVTEGGGPADVLDEIVALAGGWAILFNARGDVVARSAGSEAVPDPGAVWASLPASLIERRGPVTGSDVAPTGTRVALAVGAAGRREGILVFGKDRRLDPRDRIVVHHAVTVLGLLLGSRRAVIDAERRVAGDILNEAFAGRLPGPELERRLHLVGFTPGARLTALVVDGAAAPDELVWHVDVGLAARARCARTAVVGGRVVALVDHDDPETLGVEILGDLGDDGAGVPASMLRVGVGEAGEPSAVRRSYLGALFALRAAPSARPVASPRDLGSYGFLLGAQPRPVLEGFVRSILGPLIDRDAEKDSRLVESVRAFVSAGGRWETGADALGVHRHTLRYRVRQAEDLLGRDLGSAEDRMEVWLALKAAEVLEE